MSGKVIKIDFRPSMYHPEGFESDWLLLLPFSHSAGTAVPVRPTVTGAHLSVIVSQLLVSRRQNMRAEEQRIQTTVRVGDEGIGL